MKKTILSITAIALVSACSSSSDSSNNADSAFFDVAPCPNQDILKDSTSLAALKTAMTSGTLTYMDIPYVGTDADNFKKKCGLAGYWDPALATDDRSWSTFTVTSFLSAGNAGICVEGADPQTYFTSDEPGFPIAGTYYKQFKVAYQNTTYLVRTRSIVSGSAAGNRFSEESISDYSSYAQTTAAYDVNGTASTHDTLWNDLVNAMTATGDELPKATLNVKKGSDTTIWTAETELFCAATL